MVFCNKIKIVFAFAIFFAFNKVLAKEKVVGKRTNSRVKKFYIFGGGGISLGIASNVSTSWLPLCAAW